MRKSTLVHGLLLGIVMTVLTAVPALAHGGSVDPPTDQVDCMSLALDQVLANSHENAAKNAPRDGLNTAAVSEVVSWSHCD